MSTVLTILAVWCLVAFVVLPLMLAVIKRAKRSVR